MHVVLCTYVCDARVCVCCMRVWYVCSMYVMSLCYAMYACHVCMLCLRVFYGCVLCVCDIHVGYVKRVGPGVLVP